MNRNIAAIVGMGVLLIALVFGMFVLGGDDQAGLPVHEGPAPMEYIFQYERPPVSVRLEVRGQEPFYLMRLALDEQRGVVSDSTIPGKEHLPLDTARINGVLSASRNLTLLEVVHESVEDYAPFGLEDPRARVVLDFEEQGTRTLVIGDVAPGNLGVYVRMDAHPAIYLSPVFALDNFLRPYLDFLNMSVTPLGTWPPQFESMTLGGRVRESSGEIVLVPDPDNWFRLEQPMRQEMSPFVGPSVVQSVFGIQAAGVAAVQPSRADLDALGFDAPWATVSVTGWWGGDFTLHATQPDAGGMIFLYREGMNLLYTATTHEMYWLDAQFYEVMLPFAVSFSMEELSRVDVFVQGGAGAPVPSGGESFRRAFAQHTFDFEMDERGAISVLYDGQELDSENFGRFFATLTSAAMEYLTEQPGWAIHYEDLSELELLDIPVYPVMTFVYRLRDGQERAVAFYESDIPLRHYIRVDMGRVFLTHSFYVERVIEDVARVVANERVEVFVVN